MAHVASWKKEKVKELADMMVNGQVVAIVDVHGIPSPQMQAIRGNMRENSSMVMTRNNLMLLALDEAAKQKPGLEKLKEQVHGQCAIVATPMNPFKLFRSMEKTKTPAPAKPGDIAPEDIEIKAGDTPFKPGPIVGELQKVGIPAAIEGGKIVIRKDKVLVKQGEAVPEDLAKLLPKLEILPMIVGLDLRAAYEEGVIYDKTVLDVPPDHYINLLATGAHNAFALGISIVYPTEETITPLIAKAYREALSLSVEAAIPTKENVKILLAKANVGMLAIASRVPELGDERLTQQLAATAAPAAVEETKAEEKKDDEEKSNSEEGGSFAGFGGLFD